MANASIGKGSLVLTTEDKATPALAHIGNTIQGWASKTSAGLKGMLNIDKGSSWVGALKGGVAGLAAGFGAGAFTGAIGGIKELAAEGRRFKALGIDSAQGMGLEKAFDRAGLSAESFTHALAHMGKDI